MTLVVGLSSLLLHSEIKLLGEGNAAPLLSPDFRLHFLEDSLFFADLGLDGSFLAESTAAGLLPGLLADLRVYGLFYGGTLGW